MRALISLLLVACARGPADTGARPSWPALSGGDPLDGVHILVSAMPSVAADSHALSELRGDLSLAWSYDLPDAGAMGATRLDDGDTALAISSLPPDMASALRRIQPDGAVVWTQDAIFPSGLGFAHGIVSTPDGAFISMDTVATTVFAFTSDGQVGWSLELGSGEHAGTPNGIDVQVGDDGQVLLALTLLRRSEALGEDQLLLYRLHELSTAPTLLWRVVLDQTAQAAFPHGPRFQPDGTVSVCPSARARCQGYDPDDGSLLWQIPGEAAVDAPSFPRDAAFLPDGTMLIVDGEQELLRVRDPLDTFEVIDAVEVPGIFQASPLVCGQDGGLPCLGD